MTVDLPAVHVLHGVLSLVGVGEFDVAETAAVLRVEAVGGELYVLDLSVAAEDLDDMVLGDVACETTDMDA